MLSVFILYQPDLPFQNYETALEKGGVVHHWDTIVCFQIIAVHVLQSNYLLPLLPFEP